MFSITYTGGLVGDGLERYLDPEQCQSCADSSSGLITTLVMSVISVLPTITTDVLRMYPNYDVNCQKFFGTIISTISMLLSILTYYKYTNECFSVFYEGVVPYYLNQTVATGEFFDDEPIVETYFGWTAGPGVICMFVATGLKIIDIIAMLMVPTPQITRDHELQKEYERLYKDIDSTAGVIVVKDEQNEEDDDAAAEQPQATNDEENDTPEDSSKAEGVEAPN